MNGAGEFSCEVDLVIVGGGVAGLWLANVLSERGYRVLVFEAHELGGGQTLASQGMIHGGLKYALGGNLSRASEAIASMPDRWRACLNGVGNNSGDLDLGTLTPLSDRYYLFAEASTLGHLTGFFASKSLRGRIEKLKRPDYPPVFRDPGFDGVVYAMNDLVLDTRALLNRLREKLPGRVYRHRLSADEVSRGDGNAGGFVLHIAGGSIRARQLILSAGAGTQTLLDGLGIQAPQMQLRPLHQVVVRHRYPQPMYAHCLTGINRAEPRLTITSHADGDGWLWYLGGQLATDGVGLDEEALAAHAREELQTCVPWISWTDARISTVRVDRAEPRQSSRQRPDEAFAAAPEENVVVCWPTKLSLVPDLADKVLPLLVPAGKHLGPDPGDTPLSLPLPSAGVGTPPWET